MFCDLQPAVNLCNVQPCSKSTLMFHLNVPSVHAGSESICAYLVPLVVQSIYLHNICINQNFIHFFFLSPVFSFLQNILLYVLFTASASKTRRLTLAFSNISILAKLEISSLSLGAEVEDRIFLRTEDTIQSI